MLTFRWSWDVIFLAPGVATLVGVMQVKY